MFTMFQRPLAGEKAPLLDFTAGAQSIMRWLSLTRRRSAKRSLQLLESVPLTAQASIALVRFESETLVLGVTPRSVTVLTKGAVLGQSAAAQAD
jgi:flagellar biogenesis protein FliO